MVSDLDQECFMSREAALHMLLGTIYMIHMYATCALLLITITRPVESGHLVIRGNNCVRYLFWCWLVHD